MITMIEGKCQWEPCDEPATHIASGRARAFANRKGHPLGCYCAIHAEVVADDDNPEYTVDCPNCGCQFGVN